ncbi:MAG: N-glycosylase/DNA lyase [Nanoarchaeota archaeon]
MTFESVIKLVEDLKQKPVKSIIDARMEDFAGLGKKSDNDTFKELCFCLLTANFNARGGIKIQKEIGDGFLHLSEKQLSELLTRLGHRFPNSRAKFIIEARENFKKINLRDENIRESLVKNIKGLGMKEASHFLRNIGFSNYAIIDFHIIDFLVRNGLTEKPKTLTEKKYLEIESVLEKIAEKTNLSLGEIDLYLWYLETGKVLK